MASVVALTAFPMVGTYSASKAAVRSLTQSSRAYLASQGTTVIGVYPGPVDTEKVTAAFKNGVLTVTMPKAPTAKGTQIPVKAE